MVIQHRGSAGLPLGLRLIQRGFHRQKEDINARIQMPLISERRGSCGTGIPGFRSRWSQVCARGFLEFVRIE